MGGPMAVGAGAEHAAWWQMSRSGCQVLVCASRTVSRSENAWFVFFLWCLLPCLSILHNRDPLKREAFRQELAVPLGPAVCCLPKVDFDGRCWRTILRLIAMC